MEALREKLVRVETQAKEVMERVEVAEAAWVARDLERRLGKQAELTEAAVADSEAREESARQTLGRAKEELRLREARHSQQITRLVGAIERVRGKWESLRNANRRVLEKKRCEIAERREALRHASSTWISVKSDGYNG